MLVLSELKSVCETAYAVFVKLGYPLFSGERMKFIWNFRCYSKFVGITSFQQLYLGMSDQEWEGMLEVSMNLAVLRDIFDMLWLAYISQYLCFLSVRILYYLPSTGVYFFIINFKNFDYLLLNIWLYFLKEKWTLIHKTK